MAKSEVIVSIGTREWHRSKLRALVLEARIADLHIAERELERSTPGRSCGRIKQRRNGSQRHTTSRRHDRTIGTAIADILTRTGALPLAELASRSRRPAGGERRDPFQYASDDEKRGAVKSAGGKWMLRRHARREPAPDGVTALWNICPLVT